jgi:excisionase family DNA binding protein
MQKLYTNDALAELLHVSTRTIMRERQSGNLGFKRIRGRIRFTQEDVDAYLEKQARLASRNSGGELGNTGKLRIFAGRGK